MAENVVSDPSDSGVIEVRPGGRRRIDRVLDPAFRRDLDRLPLVDLRLRRDDAAQEETDLSYVRRLLHARIDIVLAEQRRRSTGGSRSVVDELPAILADNSVDHTRQYGRHPRHQPSSMGDHRRRVEVLVDDIGLSDVASLPDAALEVGLQSYRAQEAAISRHRRTVQSVVDAFNAEIASRYAEGSANVDDLLATERGHGVPL